MQIRKPADKSWTKPDQHKWKYEKLKKLNSGDKKVKAVKM